MLFTLDIETTGLNPDYHEIVQIAILPEDPKVGAWVQLIRPNFPIRWSKEAADINGLEERSREQGLNAVTAYEDLLDWVEFNGLAPMELIVKNWAFDSAFLHSFLGEKTYRYLFNRYVRDVQPMALFLKDAGLIDPEGFPQEKLAKYFNIPNPCAHDALEDCKVTYAIYKALLEMFK